MRVSRSAPEAGAPSAAGELLDSAVSAMRFSGLAAVFLAPKNSGACDARSVRQIALRRTALPHAGVIAPPRWPASSLESSHGTGSKGPGEISLGTDSRATYFDL